jgi:hypothetical protein
MFLHQVVDVRAAIILMKTLARDMKMVYIPVAILLENDKHCPSGLILNRIDTQVFADSIWKGDEVFCIIVSNNGNFPQISEKTSSPTFGSGGTWSSTMQGISLEHIRRMKRYQAL